MRVRSVLRWSIAIPFLVVMVVFALSNRDPVSLSLFPTDISVEMPLSLAILAGMGIGFFLGGFRVWTASFRHRRAASKAEETIRLMETKLADMKASPGGTALLTRPPA